MESKSCSLFFFVYLIGSTLCVIPEGEYQIGPVFGQGSRFFGHKYFEALTQPFVDKGQLKPILAKKALLGLGAVGVGALAGGAVLLAKKHHNQGFGGWSQGKGYYPSHTYSQGVAGAGGWYPSANTNYDYSQSQGQYGSVNFPSTDYGYPSSSANTGDYNTGYVDQSAYNYGQGQDNGYYGWSR